MLLTKILPNLCFPIKAKAFFSAFNLFSALSKFKFKKACILCDSEFLERFHMIEAALSFPKST